MVKAGDICPKCKNGVVTKRNGKYSKFLSCSEYYRCSFSAPIDTESEEEKERKILEKEADKILGL